MAEQGLPPHLQAQASQASGESQEADAAVKEWMKGLGKDPNIIDEHWRHAYTAYESTLQKLDRTPQK